MTPRCVCLIPTTRPSAVGDAVRSAEADGWEVVVLEDVDREGVSVMRERLLDAIQDPGTLVRYCDDDDELLPHREAVLSVFEGSPGTDVAYTEHLTASRLQPGRAFKSHLAGNPRADALRVHPWSWVARIDALWGIQAHWGSVWDPRLPIREGGFCWLRFLQQGLRIHHIPLAAYRYNANRFPESLAGHPEFAHYSRILAKQLWEVQ